MNILIQTIDGIQEVLAICPCCGEIFRLVEGKFVFPKKQLMQCEYLELVSLEKKVDLEDKRLSDAEDRFLIKLKGLKKQLAERGRNQAKQKLKKIDPVFSAKGIDPQDVKAIFDPVEYVIFHGLNSERGVDLVELVSRSPESKPQETIVKAIDKTVRKGNVEFVTLQMKDDGSFDIKKA